jgi:peptide/nickel transport system permease protein
VTAPAIPLSSASRTQAFHPGVLAASAVAVLIATAALFAPVVAPYAPDALDLASRHAAPSASHWFGTDDLGRDVLTRVLYGGRVSLAIGVLSALLAAALGAALGATAGYAGGWVDAALMRGTDAMLSIPRLPLLMIAAAITRPSLPLVVALVGVTGWMETARVVRAEVLALSRRPFVEAARAAGASAPGIIGRHLLPNAAPAIAVATTLAVGRGILIESTLSFFGVGVQPPAASWGNMLYQAQTAMTTAPWLALFPGLMILVTVMTVNVLGDHVAHADKQHVPDG